MFAALICLPSARLQFGAGLVNKGDDFIGNDLMKVVGPYIQCEQQYIL
jgi:hypothetical protein